MKTVEICGMEYAVVDEIRVRGTDIHIPVPDIRMMTDYKWQEMCLNDRLEHPEIYEDTEDVEATIQRLKNWLENHRKDGAA